ncbi:hypothetical protein LTR70_010476 [Exophiala xenobiotica]|uniref:Exo-alpha-sialidase n=1 Tax=Lithohypha guttulata TaxID=1690604 RepID=A0ABR0JSX6_9EURO|nr:hypothetical protein LTR24_010721 [Lithohypha guttulata]KAK5309232.1 hypothetical protein LTR70_010476 [Exophiala xenobiotica]
MPDVAEVHGKLIAVFETNANSGRFVVSSVTSSDYGTTWGNRQRVYTPKGANTNAGATQVYNVGGTLVESFNTDEDKATPGSYASGATKIIVSSDEGTTWKSKTTVFFQGANWPGEAVSGSELLVVTGDNGEGAMAQTVSVV